MFNYFDRVRWDHRANKALTCKRQAVVGEDFLLTNAIASEFKIIILTSLTCLLLSKSATYTNHPVNRHFKCCFD